MDPTDELWTAIRRVLPGVEELAAGVAAELSEPVDNIQLSVLIGMIALNGQLGPEAAAAAAIEAELGRLEPAKETRLSGRLFEADSLADLLAATQALEAKGSLDLETIVAIQRASGRSRPGRPPACRAAAPLRGHPAPDLGPLRRRNRRGQAGPRSPCGIWPLPPPVERTHLARCHRRLSDRRARHPRPRGGGPKRCAAGLLGVVADDAVSEARLRHVAVRHGLNPDRAYRLLAIAPSPESDPTPERPGIGEEDLELLAGRIGHLLGSTAPGAEGIGAGIRLPAVLPLWAALPSSPVRIGPV